MEGLAFEETERHMDCNDREDCNDVYGELAFSPSKYIAGKGNIVSHLHTKDRRLASREGQQRYIHTVRQTDITAITHQTLKLSPPMQKKQAFGISLFFVQVTCHLLSCRLSFNFRVFVCMISSAHGIRVNTISYIVSTESD